MWALYVVVPAIILFIITRRLLLEYFDRRRIAAFLAGKDLTLNDLQLALFAPRWGDNPSGRTYSVRATDRHGQPLEMTCRSSFWGGVQFTDEGEGPARLKLAPRPTDVA